MTVATCAFTVEVKVELERVGESILMRSDITAAIAWVN